jgi:vacuolar iron transporter family protein
VTLPPFSDHFRGKPVIEHLKEAKLKGLNASHEVHGTEAPGHFAAGADAAKETALFALLLWTLKTCFGWTPDFLFNLILLFSVGLLIWKTGRSATLGYMRMQRLHRLIEEERWEIQHHRNQEREELAQIYRAKGFEGKLLEEVLDVLMSDDNRLLTIMLEEELGLTLEAYEHPLKQSLGAFVAVLITAPLCLFSLWAFPTFGLPCMSTLLIASSAILFAKIEKNRILPAFLWNLALAALTASSLFFLSMGLSRALHL